MGRPIGKPENAPTLQRSAVAGPAVRLEATDDEVVYQFDVLSALDTLTPEAIAMTLDTGLGWSMPMTLRLKLLGTHAPSHAAQIDYLQTCRGDQDVHS